MNADNPVFQEFKAYWQLSEEMLASASKEDIAYCSSRPESCAMLSLLASLPLAALQEALDIGKLRWD